MATIETYSPVVQDYNNYVSRAHPVQKSLRSVRFKIVDFFREKFSSCVSPQLSPDWQRRSVKVESVKESLSNVEYKKACEYEITTEKARILTGTSEQVQGKVRTISKNLHQNLELSKRMMQRVEKAVIFSGNHPDRFSIMRNKPGEEQMESHKKIRKLLAQTRAKAGNDFDLMVGFAKNFHVGNCMELAAVALSYAIEEQAQACVEIFSIRNGDHDFLVIGRDPDSAPPDYKNWGPDAVIFDAWSGAYYPAEFLEEVLVDAIPVLRILECNDGERGAVSVKAFDPQTQSLKLKRRWEPDEDLSCFPFKRRSTKIAASG